MARAGLLARALFSCAIVLRLGAPIMWIQGSLLYVAATAWLVVRWMQQDERIVASSPRATPVPRVVPRFRETS